MIPSVMDGSGCIRFCIRGVGVLGVRGICVLPDVSLSRLPFTQSTRIISMAAGDGGDNDVFAVMGDVGAVTEGCS